MGEGGRSYSGIRRPADPKGPPLNYFEIHIEINYVHCKRIPQQAQIRFVVESATLLHFIDLLCCFGSTNKYLKQCTVQNCSKILEKRSPTDSA